MKLRKDYYASPAYDTDDHAAQRAAWAFEDAARDEARRTSAPLTGLAALNAEVDRLSGRTLSDYAKTKAQAYHRAVAQAYQITLPPCPPRDAGVRAVAEWAKRAHRYQRSNARAVYAAMAEDADFVAAEADMRRRRVYIDRAANRDLCRDWMTTAEAAAEAGRYGD